MNFILEQLEAAEAVPFDLLFTVGEARLVLIVTFLALLELMRLKLARAFQSEPYGVILVSRAFLPGMMDGIEPEETAHDG
jgi:segregation and condensation protein A